MKRVLFDVNVVLDVLLDRRPHSTAAEAAWTLVESGAIDGYVPGHAITTIHYLARRKGDATFARTAVAGILEVFEVAPVDGDTLRNALGLEMPDFEDAVCAAAADGVGCDAIATRDPEGFRGSPVRAVTPEALVALHEGSEDV